MKIISAGATRKASSSGLATSLAATIGVLARRSTLLVDFSTRPERIRQDLGVGSPKGLESLVDQFIRTRSFSTEDIHEQIIRYIPPAELELGGGGFGLLLGPGGPTDSYFDRLDAHRGEMFAEMLIEACRGLAYETIIFELGHTVFALRSEPLIAGADLFAWIQEGIVSDYYNRTPRERWYLLSLCIKDRRRPLPSGPEGAIHEVVPETDFAFPDRCFVESLKKRDKEYKYAASKLSLYFAEKIYPNIKSELKDGQDNRLRPRRNAWQELLG